MPYKDPAQQREFQRQWAADRRALFFSEKRCEWCGSADDLQLHHRDPNKKVSHAIWSWGEPRRLSEIEKCMVLCRNCHQRAHGEARRLEAELRNPHGTYLRYKLGCRCDFCRRGNRDYQRARQLKAGGIPEDIAAREGAGS